MSGMGFGAIEGICGTFICQYDSRVLVGMWILQAVIAFVNTFRMPKERQIYDVKDIPFVWGDLTSIEILPIEGEEDIESNTSRSILDKSIENYMTLCFNQSSEHL